MRTTARHQANRIAILDWMPTAVAALPFLLFAGTQSLFAGDAGQPRFVLSWGKKGDKPGEFSSPIGIAITKNDEVFVTDLNWRLS